VFSQKILPVPGSICPSCFDNKQETTDAGTFIYCEHNQAAGFYPGPFFGWVICSPVLAGIYPQWRIFMQGMFTMYQSDSQTLH